jgi:hypothetical protein
VSHEKLDKYVATFCPTRQSLNGSFNLIKPYDSVGFILVLQQELDAEERPHLENSFATGFDGRPLDRRPVQIHA